MAYKQNFGPSRKSGKAMSMCGVSRIVSPLNKESFFDTGMASAEATSGNAYSNPQMYDMKTASDFQGTTVSGLDGKVKNGVSSNITKDNSSGNLTKLGRLNAKLKKVKDGGGNAAKEARLQGKITRTTERQDERGERINSRNEIKNANVKKRQEKRTAKTKARTKKKQGVISETPSFKGGMF